MLTVTQLARKFGISRATILYYEKEGLLVPASRSNNGYRWYGEKETERLRAIVSYRSFGVSILDIANLLDRKGKSQEEVLKAHFKKLENEIQLLRTQQKAVLGLLNEPNILEDNMVTKEKWVEIMRASGLDDDAMTKWHQKFEEMEPEEHQKFLESLGIEKEEIKQIRSL